jgi:hypothetical protein
MVKEAPRATGRRRDKSNYAEAPLPVEVGTNVTMQRPRRVLGRDLRYAQLRNNDLILEYY